MINVLAADRYPILNDGVASILENVKGIKVTSKASSHADAIKVLKANNINVIILELKMYDDNRTDLYYKVLTSYPKTKVLLLTEYYDCFHLYRAYRRGVRAILSKNSCTGHLAATILNLMEGKTIIDERIDLIPSSGEKPDGSMIFFTPKEIAVLKALRLTENWETVAETLNLKPNNLKFHRNNINKKLGAKTASETLQKVGELRSAF